ncbi:MAG: PilZ domain-containing protein [Acidobacteria bacterium]|nr:PilZ domain-containing protein [Acidobacteriota bacterium]MBI3664447.1 PilZ domain-containing protein [Acidobacteriota bacterium]
MSTEMERRASRRFMMSLPVQVRYEGTAGRVEHRAVTRDVSFRGLYFLADTGYQAGSPIEFILTLPREITMAGDVHIRCYAQVVRVEEHDAARGVAARIDRYEFLPGPM